MGEIVMLTELRFMRTCLELKLNFLSPDETKTALLGVEQPAGVSQ